MKVREIWESVVEKVDDDLIRKGVKAAITGTIKPAVSEKVYPGHFTVVADGSAFGAENTWPGLDSWEIAGSYLLLGYERIVLDYFDFVQASQQADGNIPLAIFPCESSSPSLNSPTLQGMRYPEDVYTYKPTLRKGQPKLSNISERKWIGLFNHWQPKVNPLTVLAPICYVLTAAEIFEATRSVDWLCEKIFSLESAGKYLISRKSENDLISGAGFYVECPPRNQWDGVTQCYAVRVFRMLAKMDELASRKAMKAFWMKQADELNTSFQKTFWQGDHFAEYVHPDYGVVDLHGLSDVNWAAVAFDIATEEQSKVLWPLMMKETAFWHGNMPTQLVSKPFTYQEWEFPEPLSFERSKGPLYDVAAMGRVWFLEAMACLKMGETERLRDSVLKVCRMGERYGWLWYERYHPLQVLDVYPAGPKGYCEYAAILVRIVLENQGVFCSK